MKRADDASDALQYFLTVDGVMRRLRTYRDTVLSIPFAQLPYTISVNPNKRTRHYLVRDLETYERIKDGSSTPDRNADEGAAPDQHLTTSDLQDRWRMRHSRLLDIPFDKLPYRLSPPEYTNGKHKQTRSYLLADVEAYQRRSEAVGPMPTAMPAASRDQERETRIREMRAQVPTPTLRSIGQAFGISLERVRQIIVRSGGDPATEHRHSDHEATRVERKFQRLVPERLMERALACDRVITALRACAARHTYVPPAAPPDRFEKIVGYNVTNLQSLFGSFNKALEAAGLPTRPVGKKWLKRRKELLALARWGEERL